jgi:uncharacterized membrane protein
MKGFYLREMGDRERGSSGAMNPRLLDAGGIYLALVGGVVLFALPRVNTLKPLAAGLLWGVLYGLAVYAVYDLTNSAPLEHWPEIPRTRLGPRIRLRYPIFDR